MENKLLSETENIEEKNQIIQRFKKRAQIRQAGIDETIKVKICDLGNACW